MTESPSDSFGETTFFLLQKFMSLRRGACGRLENFFAENSAISSLSLSQKLLEDGWLQLPDVTFGNFRIFLLYV